MAYAPARTLTVFASAERAETVNSRAIPVPGGVGAARFRVNATAIAEVGEPAAPGTPSVVFKAQGQAPNGTWYDILSSTAVTAVSTRVLTFGRGLTTAANSIQQEPVPSRIRLVATHADADPITYDATVEFFG